MDTIKNYIKYYKDISFEESPFNDVDNILFSALVYLDFEGIANKDIRLRDAGTKFFADIDYQKHKNMPLVAKRSIDNFELLFTGKRYGDIILSNYEKVVDNEKQFCAMTYKLPDGTIYVAYEGTDDSLIGWKEDFEMTYCFPVPAQKMAIDYINRVIKFKTKKVIVGGHSKGGNLAMVASMYARPYIKRRIIKVYNNDGPGFKKEQTLTKEYKQMLPKLKMFVPEDCLVGFLLRHCDNYTVIKSSGKGLFEHNLNLWNCYGPILVKGSLSENSKNMEKKIISWLDKHNDLERKQFVDAIFSIFEKGEITSLCQLRKFNLNKLIKLIKFSREIDKESKDLVLSAIKNILFSEEIDMKGV